MAQRAVGAGHVQQIIAFADGGRVAAAVGDGRELHIGADQAAEDSSRCGCCKAGLREQCFLFLRQYVRCKAQQIAQIKFKFGKIGFINKALNKIVRQRQNFRFYKGNSVVKFCQQAFGTAG